MLRVCAYCRVSTDKNDQLNSAENQYRFFKEYIEKNPEWELVEVFSDYGLSGTTTKNRTEFNRMIESALSGEIDLIITKEVSRFARNTVDALSFTRLLKSHNVGVFFLTDNINTLNSDGELRLALLSTIAQEESRKTSQRVIFGQTQSMKRGVVFGNGLYGYKLNKGILTINEEQAKTVKKIFELYTKQNLTPTEIAKRLNKTDSKFWHSETIRKMLKNEKYCGDLVCRKQITTDYLNHTRVKNDNPKITIKNHHPRIISRSTFQKAQKLINTKKYFLSGKIKCEECKKTLIRHSANSFVGWRCKCATINEKIILSAINTYKHKIEEIVINHKENKLIINPNSDLSSNLSYSATGRGKGYKITITRLSF